MSHQTLVIGDLHGCADELEALLDKVGPDRVVSVGDLFTKGPHPGRVWAMLRDVGAVAVLGNHDQRLLDVVDGRRPNDRVGGRAIADLDAVDRDWLPFVRRLPLFRDLARGEAAFTVVHAGLHPSGDRARTPPEVATRVRRWPPEGEGGDADPFWWQVYDGASGVVFGHDARRGLVRRERDGRPWLIGLDTGCVYGGQLSGWIVERDVIVQVAARAAYTPM